MTYESWEINKKHINSNEYRKLLFGLVRATDVKH
jgi:hypothetical protein